MVIELVLVIIHTKLLVVSHCDFDEFSVKRHINILVFVMRYEKTNSTNVEGIASAEEHRFAMTPILSSVIEY